MFLFISREAKLFVGWVSGSVTHAGVGFHASTQPTFSTYFYLFSPLPHFPTSPLPHFPTSYSLGPEKG
ncbi:MAG: hypothetical protein DWQ53_11270 [Microcystis flos-aquae DF17]|nr:MAG: hypothetical protein DWQ53_11270 [Microcystis flos-aquae DF17]